MLVTPYITFAIFIIITASVSLIHLFWSFVSFLMMFFKIEIQLQQNENVQVGAWNGLYCTTRGAPM